MAKKRKLNSKNPKYGQIPIDNPQIDKKRVHLGDLPITDITGKKTGKTAPIYAVFYED